MEKSFSIPPIKMAEVFVDGRCIGLLSDVRLSREEDGGFKLEGDWSGWQDVLGQENSFTIAIPRYECRFLADKVDTKLVRDTGRIIFNGASFLPDSPKTWFETFGEAAEA